MAKSIYIGVDGKARKAKNIYIGVDGKARKVKKMYIGVNGVARLCYTSEVTISIGATTNQTYVLTINGVAKAATSSATNYTVDYGSTYSIVYTASASTAAFTYTASATVSGTATEDISIPAKTATANLRYYNLTVPATTNQTYVLKLAVSTTYGGALPSYTTTATSAAQNNLSCPYGTTYTITYTGNTGYNGGATKTGTVTSTTTVTHNTATLKTYTFTITQSANQTITVVCGGTSHTSTFTATHGQTWTASISASTGYNAGTLSATSGTVTGAVTVSATAATLKIYTYTINQPTGGTITVTVDGVAHTSTFTVQHGKTASNKCTPNSGYTFKTFTLSGSYQTASANTLAINGDAEIGAVLEKENEDV